MIGVGWGNLLQIPGTVGAPLKLYVYIVPFLGSFPSIDNN